MDNVPPPFPPPAPSFQPPPDASWWTRNWKWFVPTGCTALVLLITLFVGGILLVVMTAIKSSDAYKNSFQRATNNPQIIRALGTPISAGLFITGNINVSGSAGNATLSYPLSGPKGAGTLSLVAAKSEGVWEYSKLNVRVDKTGEVIDLRQSAP